MIILIKNKNKYIGHESISIPSIANKFNINSDYIFQKKLKKLIEIDIYRDILKIFISAFSRTKYKESDIISKMLIINK